ncbi:hypothetical protein H0E87_015082, partial [Populus deltoides]
MPITGGWSLGCITLFSVLHVLFHSRESRYYSVLLPSTPGFACSAYARLSETFQLDDKEKTMEGDGYVIARICSIVIVILIGSSRNHFPLSSLLRPTIWVGFCLRLYLCGLSREK